MFKLITSSLLLLCLASATAIAENPPEPRDRVEKESRTLPFEERRRLIHERAMREAEARRMRLQERRNAVYYRPRPMPVYRGYYYRYNYSYRYQRYNYSYPRFGSSFGPRGVYFYFRVR